MREKRWRYYALTVNGLPQEIRYNEATVEGLFLPLLHRLAALHDRSQRKIPLRLLSAVGFFVCRCVILKPLRP